MKVVSRDSQVSLESTFQTKLAIRDFPKTEESFARNNLKLESGDEGYGQYVDIENMEYDVNFGPKDRIPIPTSDLTPSEDRASGSTSDLAPNSEVAVQNVDRLSRSSSEIQFEMG